MDTHTSLGTILSAPMPALPLGDITHVAGELRDMESPAARDTWCHTGWAEIVGWITRRVPDCDPVVPAIHAIRHAPEVRRDPSRLPRVERLLLAIARRAPADRLRSDVALVWDPVETTAPVATSPVSLANEIEDLFRAGGITLDARTWETVSTGVDIAVDWMDGLASHVGLSGDDLLATARNSEAMSSEWRLRRHLPGPAGRPLVALLLGGDQWGRAARRSCGQEASLLLWALELRRARLADQPDPTPPAPVVRAWSTTVRLIDVAIGSAESGTCLRTGPTVAA
jgi:hypothetical protein